MHQGEGTLPASALGGGPVRRVAVFIDYWWVYSSARQVFGGGGGVPPAWFGNVTPSTLARVLVKRPPAAVRRSERVPAGVHVFVRSFEPEVHRGQLERVQRWQAEGATVDVGPKRGEGAGFWQGSVSVALACAVVDALARGECDTAVVFAGDVALLPMVLRLAGEQSPSSRVELATWVAADGSVPTTLVQTPEVWCHRLGEATFKHVSDDRRAAHAGARKAMRQRRAAPGSPAGPSTAMAAAFRAAELTRRNALPRATPAAEPDASPPAPAASQEPLDTAPSPLRRLTHRLFGKGA